MQETSLCSINNVTQQFDDVSEEKLPAHGDDTNKVQQWKRNSVFN